MKIAKYAEYTKTNEEFVLGAIKGALGKLFNFFANAFKDLQSDFKKDFKEDDPSTIKDIIMKNIDQAIDGAQKEINNIQDSAKMGEILPNMVTSLVELGNGIGKDIVTALGAESAKPVEIIAKGIILGSKELNFPGIVGMIDPNKSVQGAPKDTSFPFSVTKFAELTKIDQSKPKDINVLKKEVSTFFDNFQKQIKTSIDKLTDEKVKELFDKIKGGGSTEEYKVGDTVIYLLKDKKKEEYDPKKKPDEQKDVVGIKKIEKIEGDKVFFKSQDGKDIIKTKVEIMGKSEGQTGENAKKAAENLGKIKGDEEKMGDVATFAEFIQNDANKGKTEEIKKIMSGGTAPTEQ
jgi:hypothetical protein